MTSRPTSSESAWNYVWLVLLLSIPFWLIGAWVDPQFMPFNLPASALMAFNPAIAALILTYREHGWDGIRHLLPRPLDGWRIRHPVWYLPIFGLLPLVTVASFAVMNLTGKPTPTLDTALIRAPLVFLLFFITAAGEELGWQGYAFPALQKRFQTLRAGLILGLIWAVWHWIPFLQAQQMLDWILWHSLVTIGLRLVIVWVCVHTGGSIFAASALHAMSNVSTLLLTQDGLYYDPFITSLFMALLLVAIGWWEYRMANA